MIDLRRQKNEAIFYMDIFKRISETVYLELGLESVTVAYVRLDISNAQDIDVVVVGSVRLQQARGKRLGRGGACFRIT